MVVNIIYTVFFTILNLGLYCVLNNKITLNKRRVIFITLTLLVVVIFHYIFSGLNDLMLVNDFLGILSFSFGLIILHFGAVFQLRVFDYFQPETINSFNKN
jgi:predicted membrane channel-forming protein YqfA (hemolysin III family)